MIQVYTLPTKKCFPLIYKVTSSPVPINYSVVLNSDIRRNKLFNEKESGITSF